MNVKCLIDGFVTETPRNLFRAPGFGPASALPMNGPATFPYHDRAIEGDAVGCGDEASKSVLDVVAKGKIGCKFRHFRPSSRSISMPLCSNRTIVEVAAACR